MNPTTQPSEGAVRAAFPETIPQGSLITPREPIEIGRIKGHPGQTFWITDSTVTRPTRQFISIARSGKSMADSIHLSFADFTRFFAVVSDFST